MSIPNRREIRTIAELDEAIRCSVSLWINGQLHDPSIIDTLPLRVLRQMVESHRIWRVIEQIAPAGEGKAKV